MGAFPEEGARGWECNGFSFPGLMVCLFVREKVTWGPVNMVLSKTKACREKSRAF